MTSVVYKNNTANFTVGKLNPMTIQNLSKILNCWQTYDHKTSALRIKSHAIHFTTISK